MQLNLIELLQELNGVDLDELIEQDRTIFIKGQECDPKYLKYVLEYYLGELTRLKLNVSEANGLIRKIQKHLKKKEV